MESLAPRRARLPLPSPEPRLSLAVADDKPASLPSRVAAAASALADGTLRVGPKHTWHAIKAKPLQYGMLLGGIGALGAGFMAAGVDPEPYAIGLSAVVCGWSAYKGLPEIRALEGADRWRSIGSHVLWPAALCVATVVAGQPLAVDHHVPSPSLADIAKAGAQSVVIGGDVPTIVQTVLDVPEGPRQKRRFRRWLFGHGPAKAPDVM